jgi:hypothetical protein
MHQPLTDAELRDLVARCDGSFAAKQLSLSYVALRNAYEELKAQTPKGHRYK